MTRRIVAIDDSEVVRDLVVATLAEFGYDEVTPYGDSREALARMSEQQDSADLVLLDVMMPGMDGVELCARLRQLEAWRDVPIVMLTSLTDKASLARAFMAGANDYITKPFERVEFQARLNAQLRLKSELDRRRDERDSRRGRGRSQPAGEPAPDALPPALGFIGQRDSLLSALHAHEPSQPLVVYAIAVDALVRKGTDFTDAESEAIMVRVAETLSRVELPAGDALVRWDAVCFCGATVLRDAGAMADRLRGICATLEELLAGLAPDLRGAEPTVSAGIAGIAPGRSVSDVIGEAFRAMDEAGQAGGDRIVLAPAPAAH